MNAGQEAAKLAGWDLGEGTDRTVLMVLDNHDHSRALGIVHATPAGGLRVRFQKNAAMTRKQFFEVFGNCGIRVIESSHPGLVVPDPDVDLIIEAEILEWSRPAIPSQPG